MKDKLYERAPHGIRPKWMRHRAWARLDRQFEAREKDSVAVRAHFAAKLERLGMKRR